MHINIIKSDGKKGEEIFLPQEIFGNEINYSLIKQSVMEELKAKRKGTACTKKRGEVRGSTRKPWKQKGTGRARAGTLRSPIWRGGGIVWGPRPRKFHSNIPKKMKRISILSALSYLFKNNNIRVIEDISVNYNKTKHFFDKFFPLTLANEKFSKYKNNKLRHYLRFYRLIFIIDKLNNDSYSFRRLSKNLPWIKCLDYNRLNVYDLSISDELVVEKSTIEKLEIFYKKLL